jgi:hypothetical protein
LPPKVLDGRRRYGSMPNVPDLPVQILVEVATYWSYRIDKQIGFVIVVKSMPMVQIWDLDGDVTLAIMILASNVCALMNTMAKISTSSLVSFDMWR